MSPYSRRVISRALGYHVLPLSSRPCPRRLIPASLSQLRIVPSVANSSASAQQLRPNLPRCFSTSRSRQSQTPSENLTDVLPICCPGCGAFSQTIEPNEPGYYSESRKQTRKLLASRRDALERQVTESGDAAESIARDSGSEDITQQQRDIEDELAAPKPIQGQ